MKKITIKQGECLAKIAYEHDHFIMTIWDHPDNRALKAKRKDPHVLKAGDVVMIPDKQVKQVNSAAEKRHTFRRKGIPAEISLRFVSSEDGKPMVNIPYRLVIDGKLSEGNTDNDGCVIAGITPNAKGGHILLDSPGCEPQRYDIQLRELDPSDSISGMQNRLSNLGFYQGAISGEVDDETEAALRSFQKVMEIKETGEADTVTQDKLVEVHGS